MCKKCDNVLAVAEWWEPFVPQSHETPKQYLGRAGHFDNYGMQFVMIKIDTPDDLVTVGMACSILGIRHAYEPGQYAVQVIRDVVFLAYSQEFQDQL
jgi:hypothetical protein